MARKKRPYPSDYIYYDLSDNEDKQKKYSEVLDNFSRRITNDKLAQSYVKKVRDIHKPQNPKELKEILHAAKYLQNNEFSKLLYKISSTFSTDILASNNARRKGRTDDQTRRVISNKKALTTVSANLGNILNDYQSLMNIFRSIFNNNDIAPYLTLLKEKVYKGDPEILSILNTLGSTGKHILTEDRTQHLNEGMLQLYKNMLAILQTVEAAGKSSLAEYVRTGGVLNFGGGNLNFAGMGGSKSFQIAKLIDMLDMTTKALGGIAHEVLTQDVVSIEKIRSMLKKDVVSGMRLNAKGSGNGFGMYINNIRLTGTQTDVKDSLGFKYQTKDLDITIAKNQGSIRLEIPAGISLKKSSKNSRNGMNDIQIKSSTFGKMMTITKTRVLGSIWNKDVDIALANLFGSYDSKNSPEAKAFQYSGVNDLLNRLNLSFIVAGLAGGLTASDLTTILLVNDKAYNVYDIIKQTPLGSVRGGLTVGKIKKASQWNQWVDDTEVKKGRSKKSASIGRRAALKRSNNFYWDLMEGRKAIPLALKLSMKI